LLCNLLTERTWWMLFQEGIYLDINALIIKRE
jgi:hypothetical protein